MQVDHSHSEICGFWRRIAYSKWRATVDEGTSNVAPANATFITGQATPRTGLSKVEVPGATVGLQAKVRVQLEHPDPSYSGIHGGNPGSAGIVGAAGRGVCAENADVSQ